MELIARAIANKDPFVRCVLRHDVEEVAVLVARQQPRRGPAFRRRRDQVHRATAVGPAVHDRDRELSDALQGGRNVAIPAYVTLYGLSLSDLCAAFR